MIYGVHAILSLLFSLLELTIFIECIASWIPQIQGNKYMNLIHNFIQPLLEPFRKIQDRFMPGLQVDFSPVFALLVINLIRGFIF